MHPPLCHLHERPAHGDHLHFLAQRVPTSSHYLSPAPDWTGAGWGRGEDIITQGEGLTFKDHCLKEDGHSKGCLPPADTGGRSCPAGHYRHQQSDWLNFQQTVIPHRRRLCTEPTADIYKLQKRLISYPLPLLQTNDRYNDG